MTGVAIKKLTLSKNLVSQSTCWVTYIKATYFASTMDIITVVTIQNSKY